MKIVEVLSFKQIQVYVFFVFFTVINEYKLRIYVTFSLCPLQNGHTVLVEYPTY